MEWYKVALLIGVGGLAGFINTLAGSGSLLTLPLLMFLGLPATVANGTNRISILLQSAVAVASFKKKKVFEFKETVWLVVPAIAGSILGALIAADLNEKMMRYTIAALLFIMFFLILYKPDRWVKGKAGQVSSKPTFVRVLIFFAIGVYGGFIQAGVGFFLLSGLVLGAGYDLVKANSIKNFIVMIYTIFALAIFIMNDQVNFTYGLLMAVGSMGGAWLASKLAIDKGAQFVRYILLIMILVSAIELSGFREYLFGFIFRR